ncbi:MAG: hypothetical protein MI919_16965 [Holophagales bacterium]|nr:hypothetical protein [Holophagales bacterium]
MIPYEPAICFHLAEPCPHGATDGAEAICEACDAYARLLAPAVRAEKEADRPLPAALAERLQRLGGGAPLTDRASAAQASLDESGHAQPRARDVFEATLSAQHRPRPLPADLRRRLRAIPRQTATASGSRSPSEGGLPTWLADGRYATAACALLTALLTLAAGDVSARFQETTSAVTTHSRNWKAQGSSTAGDLWVRARSEARNLWQVGKHSVETWIGSAEKALDGLELPVAPPTRLELSRLSSRLGLDPPGSEEIRFQQPEGHPEPGEPLFEAWAEELRQLAAQAGHIFETSVARLRDRPNPTGNSGENGDPATPAHENPSSQERDDLSEGSLP